MFTIEKGIPIPNTNRGRPTIYPFRQMEVGDSFVVPANEATNAKKAATNLNYNWPDAHFITRKQPNGDLRIWRDK